MKKLIKTMRAWFRGEEMEAEFHIPVPLLLLIGAIIIFVVVKACL